MNVTGMFDNPQTPLLDLEQIDDVRLEHGRIAGFAEAYSLMDLSPIIKRFGTWAVTTYGVECLAAHYAIEKDRLDESDWLPHVGHKPWVIYEDFRDAFWFARKHFTVKRTVVITGKADVPRTGTRRPRHKVSTRVRFAVMRRDGYRCQLCGRTANEGVQLDIDHKLARSKGGSDDIENLWVLCSPCNNGKSAHEL